MTDSVNSQANKTESIAKALEEKPAAENNGKTHGSTDSDDNPSEDEIAMVTEAVAKGTCKPVPKISTETDEAGITWFLCPFPNCPKKFKRDGAVTSHVSKIHTNREEHIAYGHSYCNDCGRWFCDKGTLTTHIKKAHTGALPPPKKRRGESHPEPAPKRSMVRAIDIMKELETKLVSTAGLAAVGIKAMRPSVQTEINVDDDDDFGDIKDPIKPVVTPAVTSAPKATVPKPTQESVAKTAPASAVGINAARVVDHDAGMKAAIAAYELKFEDINVRRAAIIADLDGEEMNARKVRDSKLVYHAYEKLTAPNK